MSRVGEGERLKGRKWRGENMGEERKMTGRETGERNRILKNRTEGQKNIRKSSIR